MKYVTLRPAEKLSHNHPGHEERMRILFRRVKRRMRKTRKQRVNSHG